jgi:hypothetical protein
MLVGIVLTLRGKVYIFGLGSPLEMVLSRQAPTRPISNSLPTILTTSCVSLPRASRRSERLSSGTLLSLVLPRERALSRPVTLLTACLCPSSVTVSSAGVTSSYAYCSCVLLIANTRYTGIQVTLTRKALSVGNTYTRTE